MALDTAAEWQQDGEVQEWMLGKLSEQPPATDVHKDEGWWQVFCLWANRNYMNESVDFLHAVEEYKRTGDGNKADEIYREFLARDAPRVVNADDGQVNPLHDIYAEETPLRSLDMFDPAYNQIDAMLELNYEQRFVPMANKVRDELLDENAPRDISAPTATQMSRDQIDQATVDAWNESALKELGEGFGVQIYEIDDLVVFDHPGLGTMDQALIRWMKAQPGVHRTGYLEMTAKGGGLFAGPGEVTVRSVRDQDLVKAAIRRVSKKKVTFE